MAPIGGATRSGWVFSILQMPSSCVQHTSVTVYYSYWGETILFLGYIHLLITCSLLCYSLHHSHGEKFGQVCQQISELGNFCDVYKEFWYMSGSSPVSKFRNLYTTTPLHGYAITGAAVSNLHITIILANPLLVWQLACALARVSLWGELLDLAILYIIVQQGGIRGL